MSYCHRFAGLNKLVLVLLVCALSLSEVASEFTQQPSNVTVREGQSTVLICALSNKGVIQWEFETVIIYPNTSLLFSITTNETYSELHINHADHTRHPGYYWCVADGIVSVPALVVVEYLSDDINMDRALVTAYVGDSVSFVCTPPSGVPSPTLRWEAAGTQLIQNERVSLSLDNATLQLGALEAVDSGIYYCIAENGLGKSVNTSAELRVRSASLQLSNGQYAVQIPFAQYCAKAGTPLSIDCLISPQPKMELVRWLYNSVALVSGRDGYYLRQNFTLKINALSVQHVGTYCCVVDGNVVTKSCTEVLMNCESKLRITAVPPYITPSWKLLLNFSYNNILLKGNPTPTVRWYKNATPVPQDRRISQLPNGSLVLHPMNLQSDLGCYTMSVAHISNVMFTMFVALPATAMPSLQLLASASVIQLQSSVTLVCSFTSTAYRDFTYRWFLNNLSTPVLNDSRHSIYTTSFNSTLHISNVDDKDAGTYFCTAPEADLSASVNVSMASHLYLLPVTLNQQPTTVCNGSVLTLECPFGGGRGRANVTWTLNNKTIITGVDGVRLEQNGKVLVVDSSQNQNSGVYACNASDGFTSFYQTLPVAVIVPGSIESVHSTQEAVEGSAVRFDCIVSGMSSPHIIWLQGWTPVYEINDSSVVQLPNGSLLINPVTSKDENTYYCAIQVCYTLDIKKFFFKVIPGNSSTTTSTDTVTVYAIVLRAGLAFSGLMLAIAIIIFVSVCCCCYCDRVRERRTNTVRQRAQIAGALRREASMRASGRKDNGGALGGSMLSHEMTTFTYGKSQGVSPTASGTLAIATQRPAFQTPPTPAPTPVSNSTAISIDSNQPDGGNQPFNFSRTNLQLREAIGEGEFGPVVLGWAYNSSSSTRSEVAVKVLLPSNTGASRFQTEAVISDFTSQMQLRHPNICGILSLCSDAEPYYVIYEYMDKGDLKRSLLEAKDGQSIAQKDLCNIVAQVSDGMAFLYSHRIIHGDLATRNCLLSSEFQVKIADLGIGHDLYPNDYFDNGSQLLPIRWMAPELLTSSTTVGPDFSLQSDIWSFGVFCWEVFTYASQPYSDLTDLEVLDQVPKGHTLTTLAKVCPSLFHSIMQACWSYKVDERPKFSTLSVAIRKVILENCQ